MAFEPVKRSNSAKTCCARKPPRLGYFSGYFFFHSEILLSHSFVSSFLTSGISSSRTLAASPFTLISGWIIFPNSAGSMSICIFVAFRQNSLTLPVIRSSQRAPIAIIRSHSTTALLANAVPCIPSIPTESGCISENAPLPSSVVVTGA